MDVGVESKERGCVVEEEVVAGKQHVGCVGGRDGISEREVRSRGEDTGRTDRGAGRVEEGCFGADGGRGVGLQRGLAGIVLGAPADGDVVKGQTGGDWWKGCGCSWHCYAGEVAATVRELIDSG